MRRLLNQIAWDAVRAKDCFFRELYHRLIPRLGVHKAVWAIAHRIAKIIWKVLHEGVRYIERGPLAMDPMAMKRRVTRLSRQLRKLGYTIEVKPLAKLPINVIPEAGCVRECGPIANRPSGPGGSCRRGCVFCSRVPC